MDAALALFARGAEVAADAGLILADTKYEFGLDRRRRADADRRGAHARLVALLGRRDATTTRLAAGDEPESLDKEVVRRAFADVGYSGDGAPPDACPTRSGRRPSTRYIDAYERLTGAAVRARRLPRRRPRIAASLTKAGS